MADRPDHYKEYRAGSDHPWCIWFTADAALDDDAAVRFTAAEGRAMGLTPPAPAPLVVTCNGHSIELSDEEADVVVDLWADYADVRDPNAELRCKTKLAGLLRDARQDPQPASDPASCPWHHEGRLTTAPAVREGRHTTRPFLARGES